MKIDAEILERWDAAYSDWAAGNAASPSADDLLWIAASIDPALSAVSPDLIFDALCDGVELPDVLVAMRFAALRIDKNGNI